MMPPTFAINLKPGEVLEAVLTKATGERVLLSRIVGVDPEEEERARAEADTLKRLREIRDSLARISSVVRDLTERR